MKAYVWFEFRGMRRFVILGAATVMILIYWHFLMPGAFGRILATTGRYRNGPLMLLLLHAAWFGGWTVSLFGRVQDLHATTDYDYESVRKLAGAVLIAGSALYMGLLYLMSTLS